VVETFDGDLDDYARWLRSRGAANKKAAKGNAAANAAPKLVAPVVSAEEKRRINIDQRENEKTSRSRVKKIEARIAVIGGELAALETRLADPATYNGPTQELMKLSQRQAELRGEKEILESEWLELYERLEA